MDEQARIPVSLPRENPTVSYWQDPPDGIANLRVTAELPESAETVIIGSGISGAAIAWNLLEDVRFCKKESMNVVMLEAREACSGATGRNGGHTKAASYRSFLDIAESVGLQEAAQIASLELENIQAVHKFAQDHNIDCDLNPCETIDIIYDEAQWNKAHEAVAAMRAALPEGHPAAKYTFHSAEEVRSKFHCHSNSYNGREERLYGGVSYFAGSLSSYKLVIGILKLCTELGLNLQTNTPATTLTKNTDGTWTVATHRGNIKASRVILATNGYTAALLPQIFQGVIVPLRGQVTAHRPGSNLPLKGCLPTTYSFIYENGYEYMIPRPAGSLHAGDIIMGGGLARAPDEGLHEYGTTDDTTINETISAYLRDTTPRYFSPEGWGDDHPDGRIRKEWTGIMGYSPDGFPFVGGIHEEDYHGLWMSVSFQGHGMVLCWMCARALVEMIGISHDSTQGPNDGVADTLDRAEKLSEWFPDAFRVSFDRLRKRFKGRLHVAAVPQTAPDASLGPDDDSTAHLK
ncbi:FAD dependent oxidoreductase domain containing protein [Rhypophila decipiens]